MLLQCAQVPLVPQVPLHALPDVCHIKDASYRKAKRTLAYCGWRDAINEATGGDVFNPPKLPENYAECIRTATVEDSRRYVERLALYLCPDSE
jgi:hypothetical protein